MASSDHLGALLRIGNEDRAVGSGGTFDHYNPVSGQFQAKIPLAGKAEIDCAVEKAAAVADEWRRWRPADRRDVMIRLAVLVRENIPEIARLAALDGGTTMPLSLHLAAKAADWHDYYAGWADKLSGELLNSKLTHGQLAYTSPEPYGVIGIIITWNGPIFSLGMKAAPALAAGNCVVVKPSEMTPFATDHYAKLVREAGIPDGVFSMLPGAIEAGEALVRHPKVEKISFTGGPIAARKILIDCAEQMKPAVLELGGKSASLVFADVDLETYSRNAVFGSICIMAGQGCALPTRILAHESIYEDLLERMTKIVGSLKIGDPFEEGVNIGPLINAAAVERVLGMLDRVRERGDGRILAGGKRCGGNLANGNFIEPTIIADVDPDSEIAQVEVFGPVLVVNKFKDEDEAVRLANATNYGLAAYINTNDASIQHRVAERLKAGGVYINGPTPTQTNIPFGGLGISGYGKEGGRAGIDEFLRYKTIAIV